MFARKFAVAAVLALGSVGVASATDFSAGVGVIGGVGAAVGQYSGSTSGHGSAVTSGGSMAETGVHGTGFSAQFSRNEGTAYAGVTGVVTPTGSYAGTAGGSTSDAVSGGVTRGFADGKTSGAVGNDFSANAWNSHQSSGAGFGAIAGGFAGIAGFADF